LALAQTSLALLEPKQMLAPLNKGASNAVNSRFTYRKSFKADQR